MALKKNTLNYLAIAAFVAVVAWLTWNANQINPGQTTLEGKPRTSFELLNIGTIGAAIAGLGALLILLFRRWSWLVASVLLGIVTVVSLAGFLWSPGQLGISDWDYYFSYHTALNKTITEFRQFPLWNPYICGGTSAIGDPEFPVFSPLFWPELLFGSSEGLQIAIFISVATFAVGVLMLAKRLGLSPLGSFFAALAASFGSVSLLEIVEGHPNILSAMWIPWVFWGWHRAYVKTIDSGTKIKSLASISQLLRNALVCGIFLALTFFQGGIYLLMYTAIAFIFLIAISRHRLAALSTSLVAGLWALGLAAIKLVPVALWLKDFQDKAYASSASILPYLHKVLLGRYLHGSENVIAAQGGGWHEYGAYIGPIVLILAAYGLWREWRRGSVKALFLAVIIALVVSSSGPLLKPIFDEASFLPRSNISRFILLAVLPIGLLAGFGLESISQGKRRFIAVVIITVAAFDLLSFSYSLSQQAFILPSVVPAPEPAPTPIAYTLDQHTIRVDGVDHTRAYASLVSGYGTMSYCSVLGPDPAVKTVQHEEDNSFLTFTDPGAKASLTQWSPNKLSVDVEATGKNYIIVNANYAKGWLVNGEPARDIQQRLAFPVSSGKHQLTFAYQPPGLKTGSVISLATILLAIFIGFVSRYRFNNKVG